MWEFISSRLAAVFWSVILVHITLWDVKWSWEGIEARHPYWRWLVVGYLTIVLHCLLCLDRAGWEEALRRGVPRKPLPQQVFAVILGGWVGAFSWLAAFGAMGAGWILGGVGGLAIGVVVAKITYIPWVLGIVREMSRQSRPALIPLQVETKNS